MKINICCVGKVKEAFYRDAIAEFEKRLKSYCRLTITEVPDEKTPEGAPDAVNLQIMKKEAEKLLSKISSDAYVIALDIGGRKYDSEGFSDYIDRLQISGCSSIVFVIGGSLGLHDIIRSRADLRLSFSDMTFPHQLMRVILLEQIYRAYRIMNGEPYHK